jgi:hypothetical protein
MKGETLANSRMEDKRGKDSASAAKDANSRMEDKRGKDSASAVGDANSRMEDKRGKDSASAAGDANSRMEDKRGKGTASAAEAANEQGAEKSAEPDADAPAKAERPPPSWVALAAAFPQLPPERREDCRVFDAYWVSYPAGGPEILTSALPALQDRSRPPLAKGLPLFVGHYGQSFEGFIRQMKLTRSLYDSFEEWRGALGRFNIEARWVAHEDLCECPLAVEDSPDGGGSALTVRSVGEPGEALSLEKHCYVLPIDPAHLPVAVFPCLGDRAIPPPGGVPCGGCDAAAAGRRCRCALYDAAPAGVPAEVAYEIFRQAMLVPHGRGLPLLERFGFGLRRSLPAEAVRCVRVPHMPRRPHVGQWLRYVGLARHCPPDAGCAQTSRCLSPEEHRRPMLAYGQVVGKVSEELARWTGGTFEGRFERYEVRPYFGASADRESVWPSQATALTALFLQARRSMVAARSADSASGAGSAHSA